MRTFLEDVAQSLLDRFGNNMSEVTVVFPGKRAGLFLNQAFSNLSSQPVWSPRYVTISELFQEASDLQLCDPIEALCLLYEVYVKHVPQPLPFDKFYHWGELMLSDFDDIDKHMVDAHHLFLNILELHELDSISYLTEEQIAALKRFIPAFSVESSTDLQKRFLRVWSKMGVIYDELNAIMRNNGKCYEGALQRAVVEDLDNNESFAEKHFVFVGFNVLNQVENALFTELKKRNQAMFYWDYDVFYTNYSTTTGFYDEAGHFIKEHIKNFGNELSEEHFDHLRQPKEIHIIAASSENIQASYMTKWLPQHHLDTESRTAVVLCNEQLMPPALQSLPSGCFKEVNVTMGYPLADTPVYSFVSNLLDLIIQGYSMQKNTFRTRFVRAVERHPFAKFIDESLWKKHPGKHYVLDYLLEVVMELGKKINAECGSILTKESVFQCYKALARLADLMKKHAMLADLNDLTLRHVILSTLRSQTIPFHGEPAAGLQMMGVLETRCLDFDHLLMLSVGEGYLPKRAMDTSLIPYVLKEGYGLSTSRNQMKVYAYYFFRLISRASHVTFVYNECNSETSANEISRFLRQIIAETNWPITFERLQANNNFTSHAVVETIAKDDTMIKEMVAHFERSVNKESHGISPSELITYMKCGLSYYYKYVAGIKIDNEDIDGIENILFGNLFHTSAQIMYQHLTSRGSQVMKSDIDTLLKDPALLNNIVDEAYIQEKKKTGELQSDGTVKLVKAVVKDYLRNLLNQDIKLENFYCLGNELSLKMPFKVVADACDGNGKREIALELGGTIDRLDSIKDSETHQDVMRVVDYKTGGSKELKTETVESLFEKSNQQKGYFFQIMVYALLASYKNHDCAVTPALYFLRNANADTFSWKIQFNKTNVENVLDFKDEFLEQIKHLIEEMLQLDMPFTAATDKDNCKYCPFKLLCGR